MSGLSGQLTNYPDSFLANRRVWNKYMPYCKNFPDLSKNFPDTNATTLPWFFWLCPRVIQEWSKRVIPECTETLRLRVFPKSESINLEQFLWMNWGEIDDSWLIDDDFHCFVEFQFCCKIYEKQISLISWQLWHLWLTVSLGATIYHILQRSICYGYSSKILDIGSW